MNFQQFNDYVERVISRQSDNGTCPIEAIEDSEAIFCAFFDTLGKKLGMRNFSKLVLENLKPVKNAFEGEVPLLLDADDAKGAAKAFSNYLNIAVDEMNDASMLINNIDKDEHCGLAAFSKKWVSAGEYVIDHPDFGMYLKANLIVDINNPKIATLKARTYVYY